MTQSFARSWRLLAGNSPGVNYHMQILTYVWRSKGLSACGVGAHFCGTVIGFAPTAVNRSHKRRRGIRFDADRVLGCRGPNPVLDLVLLRFCIERPTHLVARPSARGIIAEALAVVAGGIPASLHRLLRRDAGPDPAIAIAIVIRAQRIARHIRPESEPRPVLGRTSLVEGPGLRRRHGRHTEQHRRNENNSPHGNLPIVESARLPGQG